MICVLKYQIPGHRYIEKAIKVFKLKEATHLKSCMCLDIMGENPLGAINLLYDRIHASQVSGTSRVYTASSQSP